MENEKYFDVDQFEEDVTTEEPEEKLAVNEAKKPGFIRRGWNCVKRNKKKIAKVVIAAGIGIAGFVLGAAVSKKRDDNGDEVEDDPVYLPEPEEETDYEDEIDEEENFDSDTDEESEE